MLPLARLMSDVVPSNDHHVSSLPVTAAPQFAESDHLGAGQLRIPDSDSSYAINWPSIVKILLYTSIIAITPHIGCFRLVPLRQLLVN